MDPDDTSNPIATDIRAAIDPENTVPEDDDWEPLIDGMLGMIADFLNDSPGAICHKDRCTDLQKRDCRTGKPSFYVLDNDDTCEALLTCPKPVPRVRPTYHMECHSYTPPANPPPPAEQLEALEIEIERSGSVKQSFKATLPGIDVEGFRENLIQNQMSEEEWCQAFICKFIGATTCPPTDIRIKKCYIVGNSARRRLLSDGNPEFEVDYDLEVPKDKTEVMEKAIAKSEETVKLIAEDKVKIEIAGIEVAPDPPVKIDETGQPERVYEATCDMVIAADARTSSDTGTATTHFSNVPVGACMPDLKMRTGPSFKFECDSNRKLQMVEFASAFCDNSKEIGRENVVDADFVCGKKSCDFVAVTTMSFETNYDCWSRQFDAIDATGFSDIEFQVISECMPTQGISEFKSVKWAYEEHGVNWRLINDRWVSRFEQGCQKNADGQARFDKSGTYAIDGCMGKKLTQICYNNDFTMLTSAAVNFRLGGHTAALIAVFMMVLKVLY